MVSPFGSAPKLMETVMQEGETQNCMPKVFMTLFLDFIMNKSAPLLGGRILFLKMVHILSVKLAHFKNFTQAKQLIAWFSNFTA